MIRSLCAAVLLFMLFLASSAFANSGGELLNFQGLGDLQPVGNFYNGGGLGGTPNYGITFSSNIFGLRSYVQGGDGDFSPTPVLTPAIFISNSLNGTAGTTVTGVMNVAPGFSTGLNFFYSAGFAANQTETVTIWSGANGTGTVLATIALSNNNSGCSAPLYCNWSNAGLTFNGTAHSVTFTGPSDQIGLSDITLGSNTTAVPEPSSIYFLATGLAGMGIPRLRRFFRL